MSTTTDNVGGKPIIAREFWRTQSSSFYGKISPEAHKLMLDVATKVTPERCPECGGFPVHVRTIGLGLRGELGAILVNTCKQSHKWQERV